MKLSGKKLKETFKSSFPEGIFVFRKRCLSTQSEIKKIISKKPEIPVLFLSAEQKTGYGRFGRKFFSPQGGLWFSLFIPAKRAIAGADTALVVADRIRKALNRKYSLKLKIKKPNDIISGDGRKMAGMLVTKKYRGSKFTGEIIGIGINVNNRTDFEGINAVALKELIGRDGSIGEVLKECLQCMTSLVYD
ncbi:MAG: biotin--[acetyl-CoA-carboxylase] ligase [bacterium]